MHVDGFTFEVVASSHACKQNADCVKWCVVLRGWFGLLSKDWNKLVLIGIGFPWGHCDIVGTAGFVQHLASLHGCRGRARSKGLT